MQKKAFLYSIVYILINILFIFVALIFDNNLNVIDCISLLQIIMTVGLSIIIYRKLISVFNIFIVLTYLFHFGQSLIRILPFEDSLIDRSVLAKVGSELLIKSEIFGIICIFSITIGYLFFNNRMSCENERYSSTIESTEKELFRLKQISLTVLAISFIPMIYVDVQKILALSSGGYDSTYLVYQNGIGKYLGLLGQFCKPIFPLLIYCNKNDRRKATKTFIWTSLYLLIVMVSGDRGTSIIYVVTNLFVYYTFVKPLRLRTIVVGSFIAYFGLGLISAVSVFRYGDFTISNLIEAYQFRKTDGIIYSTLREFGGTMLTLTHSINYIPTYNSWGMGLTYVVSMIFISPWLPEGVTNSLVNYISFTHTFPSYAMDYTSLGGSILGEFFYNFGYFSPFIICFVGAFIKKIDNAFQSGLSIRKIAVYIVLLPSLFLWVRDFYVNLVFKTFWLAILILYVRWGNNEKSINNNNG